jgi:hypothetical protein
MGPLMLLMLIIGIGVLWLYLAFQPKYVNKKVLSVFNGVTLGVTLLVAVSFVANIQVIFGEPAYDKYRGAIALCGALAIESVMLLFFFLMRNFWVFRQARRPGTGIFG